MKTVFMGTSAFAVPALAALQESEHQVIAVISQPDKARGRGRKLSPPPIKEKALEWGLNVYQPEDIKSDEALAIVRQWNPDIIIVASYGQIIPVSILEQPRYGCINIHASLLPAYRGAAPIQRAFMEGEKSTGVTIMCMNEGLDTGDMLIQHKVDISDDMDHGTLEKMLAEMGANLLIEAISGIEKGQLERIKQDDTQATYAHMLKGQDELINWEKAACNIHNQIRALSPAPGAYTTLDDFKIKIFKSRVIDKAAAEEIGQVVELSNNGFWVKTGEGLLEIIEVQKEGKKRIKSLDFMRGYKTIMGKILGK